MNISEQAYQTILTSLYVSSFVFQVENIKQNVCTQK